MQEMDNNLRKMGECTKEEIRKVKGRIWEEEEVVMKKKESIIGGGGGMETRGARIREGKSRQGKFKEKLKQTKKIEYQVKERKKDSKNHNKRKKVRKKEEGSNGR